jgi:hypothetical protein
MPVTGITLLLLIGILVDNSIERHENSRIWLLFPQCFFVNKILIYSRDLEGHYEITIPLNIHVTNLKISLKAT